MSAIPGGLQEAGDFCAGVLGLRLVKRTVNFDRLAAVAEVRA